MLPLGREYSRDSPLVPPRMAAPRAPILSLLGSVGLLVYLLVALLKPEKF